MYEEYYQPIPDLNAYLKRLGMEEKPFPDLNSLSKLVYAHQTHIPFEDLDSAMYGLTPSLAIPDLFEKIILNKRGGYCFELNALFTRLLLDLGFDARQVTCRILRGRDYLPMCTHEGIVVNLSGSLYFCDVGYGGPESAGAVLIEDGAETIHYGESFQIKKENEDWWLLSRTASDGQPERVLLFNLFPQLPIDFILTNLYSSAPGNLIFSKTRLVNLRTPDGSISVTDDVFAETKNGVRCETLLKDDSAFRECLKSRFGIVIP
ncbi:MAG: arylamine N-acetyltransferase [Eubacterium sp.]|nr:arylamine N-acetyltransferase [Eubacterium sp.]